ncbi:MAG TPA: beta-N-acetylhexosaminidase, partial [Chitinophagales bacterium]|nr:beta-N-acetylhexosaminidase [Chitinophagales bacterium]
MKFSVFLLLLLPMWCLPQTVNVIPEPAQIEFNSGLFSFKNGLNIKSYGDDATVTNIARLFAERLFSSKEWKAPVSSPGAKNVVLQIRQPVLPENESYQLIVTPDSVLVSAHSYRGLFYGTQTATQLFINSVLTNQMPCVAISDTPQYAYRGMHLDVCRHFFSKEVVEQYIDLMAQLKLNYFHWHLTDDQGWRIEIKKYPRLTTMGAWRTEKDGSKYGGFYTQDDVKEVVAYAAQRYITIVPEIEMPGHSSAAIAAYPWLCSRMADSFAVATTWGVKKDIYCPSDSTFMFLKDVLDEVCALFPGKYVHLGGDEAPKEEWKQSPVAQALMKKEALKDEEELQHYFMKKMMDYLATKGKRCIGWGEIVKGGLSDSVIVMSWLDKKAGVAAAQKGFNVIMTPRFYCYFDYPQSIKDKKQAWWMVYLPIKKVYQFNPVVKSLAPDRQKLIMGGQANVWTEYIPTEKQLWRQVMPRLAA